MAALFIRVIRVIRGWIRFIFNNLRLPLFFFHSHVVSAGVELDPRHEGPHQHHASAAGDMKVLAAGGIGQGRGIEASAFVADLDANPVAAQQANDVDVLPASEPLP